MEPLEQRLKTLEEAERMCRKYPSNKNLLPYVLKELREVRELLGIIEGEKDAKHSP